MSDDPEEAPLNLGADKPLAKFLKKTAVPFMFSFTELKPINPAALEQHHLEKRSPRKLFNYLDLQPTSNDVTDLVLPVAHEEEIVSEIVYKISDTTTKNNLKFSSQSIQVDHAHTYGSIKRYMEDDKSINFYTGFESYKKLKFVFATLSPMAHKVQYYRSNVINLSTEDQFFLTLMKLRQNKCNFELSKFFNISITTVSNIFITWVNFIYQLWSRLNIWPRKELLKYYMRDHFRKYDENVRVILDGTEIKVQKPKNPTSQQASWSSYKHCNTLKVLVGATPGGLLSYCSEAYAGSVSDRQMVERSGLIAKCQDGDSILADRGFTVQHMFSDKNIAVKIPTFLKDKSQLPGLTIWPVNVYILREL